MEPPSSHPPDPEASGSLEVVVADPAWQKTIPGAERIVRRAAHAAGMEGTVVLASDRLVRDLNWRHRGKNKPTNVLTYEKPAPEIVLAHGVVHAEAAAQKRRPAHHLAHLVVHGALHLQGEDHDHPGDARRMEMLESRILHRIRVPNPWKRA
jgi:probable rRNA maturation factor